MEKGKHVFLEKPIARNVEEGREIVSAAKKNGVKFMVGYPLRFAPEFVNLKEQIENGTLGDIQTAYAVNIAAGPFFHRTEKMIPHPIPEWWLNRELTGGGALMDLGSHMINLTRWYFGEIVNIKALLGYRFNLDVEDHATCLINFKSGTFAIINAGWFSQKTAIGIIIHGTIDHAIFFQRSQNKIITAINLILGKTPKFFVPYKVEIFHFVNCIKNDNTPSPSGEDALTDLAVVEKAYKNTIK
jgi:predicted dehydrogenase